MQVPVLLSHIECCLGTRHTSVVDKNIDRTKFCRNPRECVGDLSANLDPATNGNRFAALLLNFRDDFRRVLRTGGNTRNSCTRVSEFEGNRFANATAGFCDDRDFFRYGLMRKLRGWPGLQRCYFP
jgi:hypothetical protein